MAEQDKKTSEEALKMEEPETMKVGSEKVSVIQEETHEPMKMEEPEVDPKSEDNSKVEESEVESEMEDISKAEETEEATNSEESDADSKMEVVMSVEEPEGSSSSIDMSMGRTDSSERETSVKDTDDSEEMPSPQISDATSDETVVTDPIDLYSVAGMEVGGVFSKTGNRPHLYGSSSLPDPRRGDVVPDFAVSTVLRGCQPFLMGIVNGVASTEDERVLQHRLTNMMDEYSARYLQGRQQDSLSGASNVQEPVGLHMSFFEALMAGSEGPRRRFYQELSRTLTPRESSRGAEDAAGVMPRIDNQTPVTTDAFTERASSQSPLPGTLPDYYDSSPRSSESLQEMGERMSQLLSYSQDLSDPNVQLSMTLPGFAAPGTSGISGGVAQARMDHPIMRSILDAEILRNKQDQSLSIEQIAGGSSSREQAAKRQLGKEDGPWDEDDPENPEFEGSPKKKLTTDRKDCSAARAKTVEESTSTEDNPRDETLTIECSFPVAQAENRRTENDGEKDPKSSKPKDLDK